jgi:outer membrane protein TolC
VLNRKTGVGPFLPSLSASAGHSGSLEDSASYQSTVGASLKMMVFDGFQSDHAYRRLQSQERATALAERSAVEGVVESVLVSYFEIVRQKRRLEAIRDLLAISEERAKLAQARMELGAGSKLEQLQSLADLNADSSSFLSQEMGLRESKIRVNSLLARDPGLDFDVVDSIPLEAPLPLEEWRIGLPENNAAILQADAQRKAGASGLKQAQGARWPDVNAGLSYSTQPEALNPSDSYGGREDVRYSVNLSLPLFDRLQTRRSVGNSRLELRQSETRFRQEREEVNADFEQASRRHAVGLRQVALEERNLEAARLQAEAARERYRVGSSSPLEFRDAQRRLLDAQSRLVSARQDTKLAELALKRLAGKLVYPHPPTPSPTTPR